MDASYDEGRISLITAEVAEAIEQASLGRVPWTLPAEIFSAAFPPVMRGVAAFQQLYGLTKAETRLCLSLYAGRTLQEAAAELGLSYETVRTCTKAIFVKTGTRGQPGLRALLARYAG